MKMNSRIKKSLSLLVIALFTMSFNAQAKNAMHIVVNDHLGTPQMLINENKHVVWKANYDEFGKAHIQVEEVEFNLRFPGQYYDKETGLNYNYYRDYDSSLGRYVQSDPIGLMGGINTYAYVGGNPLSYIDPYGLAYCYFSLKDSRIHCVAQDPSHSDVDIPAASGNNGNGEKCRNNPNCTAKTGHGPIPVGCWRWTKGASGKPNGRVLEPCPGTGTNVAENRSLIRSHSCKNPFGPGRGPQYCSEGCVTGTEADIKKLNDLIDSEPRSILLVSP